jgi:hypothetical protein
VSVEESSDLPAPAFIDESLDSHNPNLLARDLSLPDSSDSADSASDSADSADEELIDYTID